MGFTDLLGREDGSFVETDRVFSSVSGLALSGLVLFISF